MKRQIALAAVFVIGLVSLGLSGCGDEKGTALSAEDSAKIHAGPGQPMPAEAKAFMEKANKEAPARAAAATAPAPPR